MLIMTYAQNIWLYSVLLFGIIIVPGMDMFFVIANSLAGGRLRGLAATGGIMLGGVCHNIFAAFGVSAVLATSPGLLSVILVAGACYMFWIGYTLLKSSITVNGIGPASSATAAVAFRQELRLAIRRAHRGAHRHSCVKDDLNITKLGLSCLGCCCPEQGDCRRRSHQRNADDF